MRTSSNFCVCTIFSTPLFACLCRCRLESPQFLYTMFTPVCVMLTIDMLVISYIVVLTARSLQNRIHKMRRNIQALKVAVTSSVLLGLTWLLGLLMLADSDLNIAAQYVFAITNSFLGVFIFIVKIVLPSDVRHAWRTLSFRSRSASSLRDRSLSLGQRSPTMTSLMSTRSQARHKTSAEESPAVVFRNSAFLDLDIRFTQPGTPQNSPSLNSLSPLTSDRLSQ